MGKWVAGRDAQGLSRCRGKSVGKFYLEQGKMAHKECVSQGHLFSVPQQPSTICCSVQVSNWNHLPIQFIWAKKYQMSVLQCIFSNKPFDEYFAMNFSQKIKPKGALLSHHLAHREGVMQIFYTAVLPVFSNSFSWTQLAGFFLWNLWEETQEMNHRYLPGISKCGYFSETHLINHVKNNNLTC